MLRSMFSKAESSSSASDFFMLCLLKLGAADEVEPADSTESSIS